ncbi:glycerol-3-phosphate 1-O-acyltransferase [bacterium]|nr:MAG: glycerol-3-phosphate 1-O-acyltransferase [bacterium]RIK65444.1 MAG: acyl-phosphate glycerol 3-phosphate acyltransferase [Planctomycetota bacterium]
MWTAVAFLAAYLVGSVPFGLLAGLVRGVDIRLHGSRNIGATNAGRVLGRPWFWIVLILDAGKGASCALAGLALAPQIGTDVALFCGLGAIIGHFFPLYLRFRGGKGVATGLGVVLVLATPPGTAVPWPALTALALFLLVLGLVRMVSAGSITAALALPAAYGLWLGPSVSDTFYQTRLALLALMAVAVVVKHRENLKRILAGTEPRLGKRAAPADNHPVNEAKP